MAKGFKNVRPIEDLLNDPEIETDNNDSTPAPAPVSTPAPAPVEEKKKSNAGRKKSIDYPRTQISIKIKTELYNKWEQIKIVKNSNLTSYIENLIAKDLEENFDKYIKAAEMLKNI